MQLVSIDKKRMIFTDFENTLNTDLVFRFHNGFYNKSINIVTDIRNEINKRNDDSGKNNSYILIIGITAAVVLGLLILVGIIYRRR